MRRLPVSWTPVCVASASERKGETTDERDAEGVVKWFNRARGHGPISCENGGDLFVHLREIQDEGFKTPDEGQKVTFDVTQAESGKIRVGNVRKV
jgi:CspA family cold shock protein